MADNIPVIHHADRKDDGSFQFSLGRAMSLAYKTMTPAMIHGTFGIGKSEGIKAWAKQQAKTLKLEYSDSPKDVNNESKFMCIVINLHHFDASGFWLPVIKDGRYVKQMDAMFPVKGKGVIFFDELNLAPPLVQANAYQFFLDRRLGEYEVPDGFLVVAAGNTVLDNAHTFEMATPLKNRMSHWHLEKPTVDEWITDYALPHKIDPRVQMFLKYQNGYLHKYDASVAEDIFGIPTPRSWAKTAEAIQGLENYEEIEAIAGANVGVGIGTEFAAWLRLSMNFDIEQIYKDEKIPKSKDLEQVDTKYSLMGALVGYYQSHPSKENTLKLFRLAQQLKGEEYHIIMIRQGVAFRGQDENQKKIFTKELRELAPTEFSEFAKKYGKLLID